MPIAAFFEEVIARSLADGERKGCLLVNSALDVAPHDAAIAQVVAGHLDEIRAFCRRNIASAQASAQMPRTPDAGEISGHLLGVLLGMRVLARTRPERAVLESVVRPALRVLDNPTTRHRRRRT